ncbi:indolepyruvate ferredoxin oxidoreductase subunit alpha [Nannocystaceae bacterium ST9]
MAYVVTENCQRCRFTDCVVVCPSDCFHGDDEMLYIDPDECVDCGACVAECPVEAIHRDDELPDSLVKWTVINAERVARLPVVAARQEPLAGALARKRLLGL